MNDYARVKEAIHFIRDNAPSQPSLQDVADYLGLSPYHVQRIFRRWAGISPKRFLQYLTLEHAKRLLRDSASVLEATWDTGLSSPGRLHDLFVAAEAVTPGEFKDRGRGVQVSYGFHETPFGPCLLAATERGICALDFLDATGQEGALTRLSADWPAAQRALAPAVTGPLARRAFALARDDDRRLRLHLRGTNTQLRVWRALLALPAGTAVSYGELARRAGAGGPRAVGRAVGTNRIAALIPCHRVLRADGGLGGYRWGQERKAALLAWESARGETTRVSSPSGVAGATAKSLFVTEHEPALVSRS